MSGKKKPQSKDEHKRNYRVMVGQFVFGGRTHGSGSVISSSSDLEKQYPNKVRLCGEDGRTPLAHPTKRKKLEAATQAVESDESPDSDEEDQTMAQGHDEHDPTKTGKFIPGEPAIPPYGDDAALQQRSRTKSPTPENFGPYANRPDQAGVKSAPAPQPGRGTKPADEAKETELTPEDQEDGDDEEGTDLAEGEDEEPAEGSESEDGETPKPKRKKARGRRKKDTTDGE